MPLSDYEQQLLDQMERALTSEDPHFASRFRKPARPVVGPAKKSHLLSGLIAVLGGSAALVVGVSANLAFIGIIGFIAIVTGITVISTGIRTSAAPAAKKSASAKQTKAGFMQGLEDRWDRRSGDKF